MRTVLCSTTAGRVALLPALVAGTVGLTLALPASAADAASTKGGRHARHASHHRTAGPATDAGRQAGGDDAVLLGAAVKYVRLPDGTIREVR